MENHYSASYDVDLAKQFGVEAAALFNKLVYLSRYTAREDGFCWKTAKEIEDELGITKRQQERAVKILEDAGLIETKVTYIQGTLSRCKHYKINESALSESNKMSLSIESNKMSLSESNKTSLSYNNNQTVILKHSNKKEIYKEKDGLESLISEYTSNPDLLTTLQDYVKMRKAIHSPLTDRGLKICLNKLDKFASTDELKIVLLEQSIERGWKGIFPLKEETQLKKNEEPVNPEWEKYHIICEAEE